MKLTVATLGAGLVGAGVGLTACGTAPVTVVQSPAAHSSASAQRPATATAAKPAITKTVTRYRTATSAPPAGPSTVTATSPAVPAPATPEPPANGNVTDAWAVVSAYYGDIESGNYEQAYALIGSGATTGQTYQQFAAGFACTGSQALSENWDSGDQVNFNLAATNSCTGATQDYTGTDTVQNGIIVAASVVQTS